MSQAKGNPWKRKIRHLPPAVRKGSLLNTGLEELVTLERECHHLLHHLFPLAPHPQAVIPNIIPRTIPSRSDLTPINFLSPQGRAR